MLTHLTNIYGAFVRWKIQKEVLRILRTFQILRKKWFSINNCDEEEVRMMLQRIRHNRIYDTGVI